MEVNCEKLKAPVCNLVKFKIVQVKYSINRCQDLRNFTQKSLKLPLKDLVIRVCLFVCVCVYVCAG